MMRCWITIECVCGGSHVRSLYEGQKGQGAIYDLYYIPAPYEFSSVSEAQRTQVQYLREMSKERVL